MIKEMTVHLHMALDWARGADGHYNYTAPKVWVLEVWGFRMTESDERVYIGPRLVEVDVPDTFNPVPRQVAALEAEKSKALAKYQQTVAEVNERLSKLLAITHDVAPSLPEDGYAVDAAGTFQG